MLAFNAAWAVLKAAPASPQIERMRQYVLMNINSPASIVRESARNVEKYLTPKVRQRRGYGTYSGAGVRDDDDDDAAPTPMAKAFRVLIDSHFA